MIIFIIAGLLLFILIPLYCCLAHSTSEDRLQDDELQMEFIKDWKDNHLS